LHKDKGHQRLVKTDDRGDFQLKHIDDSDILVSFQVFKTKEILAGIKTVLNIHLQVSEQLLKDVVVTGMLMPMG
jgi:hypothetical protein